MGMGLLLCLGFGSVSVLAEPPVAVYQGVQVDFDEAEYIFRNAPVRVQQAAQNELAARYELMISTLVSKKILKNLEALALEKDRDNFFEFQFKLLAAAKEFGEALFQEQLVVPDLEPVARERYRVSKEAIASAPELRSLSHILLLCSESCNREEKIVELEKIRQRVLDGGSFADLAAEFSQDPGSRQRGGRLSRPISKADENVDSTFRDTAFSLVEVGDISQVVNSRFGFHIMRLEEVIPARVYSFEEVKEPLIAEIEKRYRQDAYQAYYLSLGQGDDLQIDYDALSEIMGALPAD